MQGPLQQGQHVKWSTQQGTLVHSLQLLQQPLVAHANSLASKYQ
jgi:hypothetical protein